MKLPLLPWSVTVLRTWVLIFTLFFLTRAYTVWTQWNFLQTYLTFGVRLYLLLSGLVWSGLGFWLFLVLLNNSPSQKARHAARWGSLIFTLSHIAERLVAGALNKPQPNTLFQIFWSLFLLTIFWLILHHPKTKEYYGDKYDPKT